jgi:isopentenyl-diphosphate delta-isomerase type 1
MPAQDPNELFDVVDAGDRVIGRATRAEVHARGLLHRAVHVFLFNSAGELLLQRRSALKDEYPLCWTSSASGHLDAGEDYAAAAVRELREELGIAAELQYLTKLPASPETANEHTALFRAVSDERPVFPPEEIALVEFFRIEEVKPMIDDDPNTFSPPFRQLFEWYRRRSFLNEANDAFAEMRGGEKAWSDELGERELWEATLSDGLDPKDSGLCDC